MKNSMKHISTYFCIAAVLISCTKTETREVEKIVEVPTAINLEQVSLSASSSMTSEADAETITITATVASALSADATINLNFSGLATLDTDYTVTSNSIMLSTGELTGTTDITILADETFESGVENIVVSLAGLPATVTPNGTNSVAQIDITDGKGIVSFSDAEITTEETTFFRLPINLSTALNDDIVVNYSTQTANSAYGIDGPNYIIIAAGEVSKDIIIDLNDSRLTREELKTFTVSIDSVANEDVAIGTINEAVITTTEVSAGLLIDVMWPTEDDIFEMRLIDSFGDVAESSLRSDNTESIFLEKSDFSSISDGVYTLELDAFAFNASNDAETVSISLLDEENETYEGPYTFTVNTAGSDIIILTVTVFDDTYTISQATTEN